MQPPLFQANWNLSLTAMHTKIQSPAADDWAMCTETYHTQNDANVILLSNRGQPIIAYHYESLLYNKFSLLSKAQWRSEASRLIHLYRLWNITPRDSLEPSGQDTLKIVATAHKICLTAAPSLVAWVLGIAAAAWSSCIRLSAAASVVLTAIMNCIELVQQNHTAVDMPLIRRRNADEQIEI